MSAIPNFLTYARFHSEKEAEELTSFLSEHTIQYEIEQDKTVLDKIYIGESLDPMTLLKIRDTDFEKVNELVITAFKVDVSQVSKDYYLFSFSNQELMDVIHTPDEWNYFDRALANKLLSGRQVAMPDPVAAGNMYTYEPVRVQSHWLVMQYLLVLLLPLASILTGTLVLYALLFSFAGILIGTLTTRATKTLHNGTTVKMYDAYTRQHTRNICLIGIAGVLLFVIRLFYYQ